MVLMTTIMATLEFLVVIMIVVVAGVAAFTSYILSHGRDHLCCYLNLSQLLRVFVKVVTHGFVEVGDHGDHDCGRGCVAHLLSWEGSTLQQLFISSKKHFSSCPKLLNNYELSGH